MLHKRERNSPDINRFHKATYSHYLLKGRIFLFLFLIISSLPIRADDKQNSILEQSQEEDISPSDIENECLTIKGGTTVCNDSEETKDVSIDKTKGLYLLIGHYAYFPELNSEKPVYIVNEIGKGTIPGWHDIVTFRDMRRIGLFGDIWAGVGLHCGNYFSFWIGLGGGLWEINNSHRYGPLKFRLDLKGIELLVETGMDYFPFGKTKFDSIKHEKFLSRLKRTILETKPYLSLIINYSHFEASGKGKVELFDIPITYQKTKGIDIISIIPCVVSDVPVTRRTDVFMGIGYLFGFDIKSFEREHKNEIEGPVATTGVKINF